MRLCKIDKAVLAAHESGVSWRTVPGIRSHRRFERVLRRARWRQWIMFALPILGKPDAMTIRKWRRLQWRDARADLVALGLMTGELEARGIHATHDDLRQKGLSWYKYVEQKQAMLFAYLMSEARLNGTPIDYAMIEDEDYDCVLQYRVGVKRGFSRVQLKEVAPFNPKATIETELAKLGKYASAAQTIAAVHVNQQGPVIYSSLSKPKTSFAEIWLYSSITADQSRWFVYGDLLKMPRGYEIAWPTRVRRQPP